jgi:hypothetical protein
MGWPARRIGAAAGLAPVALALALAPAASPAAASGGAAWGVRTTASAACPPAGSRLIARGRVTSVYSPAGQGGQVGTGVWACVRGQAAPLRLLGPPAHGAGVRSLGALAIAGTIVAYVETRSGIDSGTSSIRIVDVASRRLLRTVSGVASYVDAGIIRDDRVRALAVTSEGDFAWIVQRGARHKPSDLQVYAASRSGRASLLDDSPDIAAESLRLSGRTLSWDHGTGVRTAPLPH